MDAHYKIEVDARGADYVVPKFLAALDDLYCYFKQHMPASYPDRCLVDALRMYADHQNMDQ